MNRLACGALFVLSLSPAFAQTPVTITTTATPTGVVGTPYNFAFTVANGTGSDIWFATGLPAPLSISSGGAITGTPSTAGTFPINVQVTGTNGSDSKGFNLKINNPLVVTTSSLPTATRNVPYSTVLAATGGEGGPYTWTVIGGLPAGLTLNPATGQISGTPTDPGGSYGITVTATDTATPTQTSPSALLTLFIDDPLLITTNSPLPGATANSSYSLTFAATGGVAPYTNWIVTLGSLPPGLTLNATTGVLSGTPTTPGTSNFTIQVSDSQSESSPAEKAFQLTVAVPTLVITTSSPLTGGSLASTYNQTFAATGGVSPYTWSLATSSTLPPGLTLSSAGVLSGSPTTPGTFNFTIEVRDSTNVLATKPFTLPISSTSPVITTSSLPNGQVSVAYDQPLTASGGTSPYSWSLASGTLPEGLFVASGGAIQGTPTQAGIFTFSPRVTDVTGLTATRELTIAIDSTGISITTPTPLTAGIIGTAYSRPLAGSGGAQPYSWAVVAGQLPPGITLNATTGVLSGTPTTIGTSSFTIQMTESGNMGIASKAFTLAINPVPLVITNADPLPGGIVGQSLLAAVQCYGRNISLHLVHSVGRAAAGSDVLFPAVS